MKKLIRQLCLAAVAATIVTGCCTSRDGAASWEYKVVESNVYEQAITKQINELAGEGWTVVSVSTSYQGESTVPRAVILLKRHKKQ
jgi:hypothetical protein